MITHKQKSTPLKNEGGKWDVLAQDNFLQLTYSSTFFSLTRFSDLKPGLNE